MFGSFSRSFALVQQSWSVLRKDREILIFPVLSGLISLGVAASFVVPVILMALNQPHPAPGGRGHSGFQWDAIYYAYLFGFYLVSYFVTIFFNVGVMKCAAIRMDGGDPTIADGFKGAFAHAGSILMWSLVSATVGVVLRMIERRAGLVGNIVASLVGIAWSLLTYFAVPVIIFENTDAMAAIRRSGELFKKTWGEAVVGESGMALFFGLLFLAGLVPLVGVGILASQGTAAIPLVAIVAAVVLVYWIALAVVSAALQGIFHVALYRYAATGQVPDEFSEDLVAGNWRPKTGGFFSR
ncbi:MAG: hypothetical protein IT452_14110 [Planctomycetia bacterium]|nr:hypothetical protein [Planctomycetia bacterium]